MARTPSVDLDKTAFRVGSDEMLEFLKTLNTSCETGPTFAGETEGTGFAIFAISREARARHLERSILSIIETCGFECLDSIECEDLSDAAPGFHSEPAATMVLACDVLTRPPEKAIRDRHPHCDNAQLKVVELRLREFFDLRDPSLAYGDLVKATENAAAAWSLVRQVLSAQEGALRKILADRHAAMATHYPVLRDLTRLGSRSKVELIKFGDGVAVKKTYRQNCRRFMNRETEVMERFSSEKSEILPVLERGPNYFIMPFIDGIPLRRTLMGRSFPRLMSLKHVNAVADLIRFLCTHGYDPVDFGPHNILVDNLGRLAAIDFEFIFKADVPIAPEASACLSGLRKDHPGEWPFKARWAPHRSHCFDPWRRLWFGSTGLTLQSFLHDPPWLQEAKRAVNYPAYLVRKLFSSGRGAKSSLRHGPHERLGLVLLLTCVGPEGLCFRVLASLATPSATFA